MPDIFPIGQKINLPGHFNEPVILEAVREIFGGYELQVRLTDGSLDEAILSPEEAATIAGQPKERPKADLADAEKIRLLIESARIRLSYAHDSQFAVSISGIRTLPHQIEAVYLKMLPQPRLRFLLVDDPGAGKTIMAGLLIKEMKIGFDIRSLAQADPHTGYRDPVTGFRCIEVKGRKRGQPIRLTTNEWYKATQLGDSYWLYVAWDPLENPDAEPIRIQNPARKLDHVKREVVTSRFFEIPTDAIQKVSMH